MANDPNPSPNAPPLRSTAPVAPNPRNPNLPPTMESPLPLKTLRVKTFSEDDWIQEKYIDCILEVGTPPTRIPGHRIVLEESPALKKNFKYRTARDTLRLPNLNPLGCIEVIRWLYSGELDIQETCLQKFNHIVHAAALLELKHHINFWSIRREALRWKKTKLVDYINEMIRTNYKGIVGGELFNEFEFEELKELIGVVANDTDPIEVFSSIIQWLEVESKRGKFAESLLQLIPINQAFEQDPQAVTRVFTDSVQFPYLKSLKNLEFKRKVDNLLNPGSVPVSEEDRFPQPQPHASKKTRRTSSTDSLTLRSNNNSQSQGEADEDSESSLESSAIIYRGRKRLCVSGSTSSSAQPGTSRDLIKIEQSPILLSNYENENENDYFAIPKRRIPDVEIYEGHYGLLYPITIHGTTYLDAFDFKTLKQFRLHEVPGAQREYSSLVVGNNKLFDIGGTTDAAVSIWDNMSSSKIVEVFTKGAFKGKSGPPLRKALRVFGALCHDEIIYVTGGDCTARNETMVSSSLIQLNVYEPSPRWLMKKPMFTPRSCHDMAVLDGEIYVVGGVGSDEDSAMKKAERYSTVYECWTKLPDMNTGRRCLRVIAWKNKILAIGGEMTVRMSDYRYLSSVEAFDPETNTWELMAPMKYGRKSFGVVVVEDMIYVIGGNAENCSDYNIEKFDGHKWTLVDWPDVLNRHGKFISSAQLPMNYVTQEK